MKSICLKCQSSAKKYHSIMLNDWNLCSRTNILATEGPRKLSEKNGGSKTNFLQI